MNNNLIDELLNDEESEEISLTELSRLLNSDDEDDPFPDAPDRFDLSNPDDEDSDISYGSPDIVLNKIRTADRLRQSKKALSFCKEVLEYYPSNIELIAEGIRLASTCSDSEYAENLYRRLLRIDKDKWDWTAFAFSIEYLMGYYADRSSEIRELIREYHCYFPEEEGAVILESKLEEKLGDADQAILVLENYIKSALCAPHCALRLVSLYLERNDYVKAKNMSEYFMSVGGGLVVFSRAEVFLYLYKLALIEKGLLFRREYNGIETSIDDYYIVKRMFKRVRKLLKVRVAYDEDIDNHICQLDMMILKKEMSCYQEDDAYDY